MTLFSEDLIKLKDSIIMKYKFITLIFGLIVVFTTSIAAHGGGLNKQGCHNETRTGGYHCHRSPASPPSIKTNKLYANPITSLQTVCKISIGDQYYEFKPSEAKNINVKFKSSDKSLNIDCR
tara:strand:+ start:394 stop:759 length:366 start_codon:yes stop_codon:yes gene_type:complete